MVSSHNVGGGAGLWLKVCDVYGNTLKLDDMQNSTVKGTVDEKMFLHNEYY